MKPGAKGLTFDPEQWGRLSNGLQAVNDAVSRQDETFFLDLGGNKRASVGSFHGKMMVSLRGKFCVLFSRHAMVLIAGCSISSFKFHLFDVLPAKQATRRRESTVP
jgi:hypothetical protein